MTILTLIQQNPLAFTILCGVLGLLIGSFLNVVIYRLPVMMEREWKSQCIEYLELEDTDKTGPDDQPAATERFDLVVPRSRCPKCGHQITALENVPIISYLLLRGKCSECGTRISPRYPIIEGITGIMSAVVAWHFGFGWAAGAALFLTWALIALTMIDFDHQLLPDSITLPFLWIGLLLSLFGIFTNPVDSIIGGVAGYMSLWLIYQLFKMITGKEGMGFGDFKLFAMLGTWLGWQCLPVVILLSSFVGAIVGISLIMFLGRDRNIPIPFGPYLAAAGWIYLIWGQTITQGYFSLMGAPL
jgi:leader peptidase (prepilin peptidase)/N-methyltransferase